MQTLKNVKLVQLKGSFIIKKNNDSWKNSCSSLEWEMLYFLEQLISIKYYFCKCCKRSYHVSQKQKFQSRETFKN